MRQPACPQNSDALLAELENLEALFREHPLDAAKANIPLLCDVVLGDAIEDATITSQTVTATDLQLTTSVKADDMHQWHELNIYPFAPLIDALTSQKTLTSQGTLTETTREATKKHLPGSLPSLNHKAWVLLPAELAVLTEDIAKTQNEIFEEDIEQILSELVEEIIPIIKVRLQRKLRVHFKLKTTA